MVLTSVILLILLLLPLCVPLSASPARPTEASTARPTEASTARPTERDECLVLFKNESDALNKSGNLFCPALSYRVTLPDGSVGDSVCFPPTLRGSWGFSDCPDLKHYFRTGKYYGSFCGENGVWTDDKSLLGCLNEEARCRLMGECPKEITVASPVIMTTASIPTSSSLGGGGNGTSSSGLYRPTSPHDELVLARIVAYVTFVTSILSLPLLLVSLTIFCYFRSLRCLRNNIHACLIVAFIGRNIMWIIYFEPFMGSSNILSSYLGQKWSVKVVDMLMLYSVLSCLAWTVVEGLLLTVRLYVDVLASPSKKAPYWLLHVCAWGIPLLIMSTFAVIIDYDAELYCWDYLYQCVPHTWIIGAPVILAMVTNGSCFLLVVITLARKTCHPGEIRMSSGTARFGHVSKSAVFLVPLLTLGQALFFFPPDGTNFYYLAAYDIGSLLLQTTQGPLVCIIYCFRNGEVKVAVRRWWNRRQWCRCTDYDKPAYSRRTSRASSLTTQTEHLSSVVVVPRDSVQMLDRPTVSNSGEKDTERAERARAGVAALEKFRIELEAGEKKEYGQTESESSETGDVKYGEVNGNVLVASKQKVVEATGVDNTNGKDGDDDVSGSHGDEEDDAVADDANSCDADDDDNEQAVKEPLLTS